VNVGIVTDRSTSKDESVDKQLREDEASNAQLVLRLFKMGWAYKLPAFGVIGLQFVLLAFALSGLGLTGLGIDVIRKGLDPQAADPVFPFGLNPPVEWSAMHTIWVIAGAVLGIAAVRFLLDRTSRMAKALLVQRIIVDLRAKVYDKMQRLSFSFFDANASGSIINRVTSDVSAVRMFVDGVLIEVLMLLISLVFFVGYMLSIHVWLTVWCLATTPVLWLMTWRFSRIVRPAYRKNRELFDTAVLRLSENVQGVHVVKGFSRQPEEIEKFDHANAAVRDQKRWIFWRISTFVPLIGFLPQINLVVLMIYGGKLFMTDPTFRIGSGFFVFAGLLQQFSAQVGSIAVIANSVQQSLTGAQRVFEVLDTPTHVKSPTNAVRMERAAGEVRLEGVSFGYESDESAVTDISIDAKPGQTVAVLGATGAGKSTLLSLIPRFYDPQQGRVLIDGRDVREYDLDDLRRNIGLVFQESFLFSNTVAANIAFGHPEATHEQIEKAAKIASAHGFIMELEHGYDTVLGEGGSNLSGGQRQRLAIARAILLEPAIILLDDPTAAIDPQTEHEILEAMNSAMLGRTTFVVAHRLSTLRRADKVIVLDKGRVVQTGTHSELMDEHGHYRHAASLQTADHESKRLLGMHTGDPEGAEGPGGDA
jgi:ABC-type multidrug transport system fused ATPase/permease subunit